MYIPRTKETEIRKHLHRKEIIAVIGPRQTGKTTLINHLLKDKKNVNKITLDDIEARTLFEEDVNSFIQIHIKGYDYVFIDEIQYSRHSGQRLKYIYDTHHTKILISGSSAPEVSIQSLQYLIGRVFIYHLFPLSFKEFINHKDPRLLPLLEQGKLKGLEKRTTTHLKEFITHGGYPEAVLAQEEDEKRLVLKNIYNTYILKEIRDIFGLTEDYKVAKLIKALALQTGNIINHTEIADTTDMKSYEVKRFLNILDKTFICKESRNHHTNKRTELKKSPKIFFVDTGFRNAVLDSFTDNEIEEGALYENHVASELLKAGLELKYWRTKAKAEVDFIIERGTSTTPMEIKTHLTKPKIGRSLHAYLNTYRPEKAYILSLEYEDSKEVDGHSILFRRLAGLTHILEQMG